jgi:hypothetical protein
MASGGADLTSVLMERLEWALRRIDKLESDVRTLSRPAAKVAMVEALAMTYGEAAFVTAETRKLANGRPELDAAIIAAVCVDWTPKKLGNALSSLQGETLGGYVVIQLSRDDRAGAIWRIVKAL